MVSFIALVILLLLSGFFSSSETALISLSRAKVKHLVEKKEPNAEIIANLLSHSPRLLAAILLGNNLVNIMASALATAIAIRHFKSYGVGIATGVMTFLILVFGEIGPKTYAIRHAEKIALRSAKLINVFIVILYPIARLLVFVSNLFLRLFGQAAIHEEPFLTEGEIKAMLAMGEEEGIIEEGEREMIHSIFEFGDTIVKEVMVPRMDVICIDSKKTLAESLRVILEEGYSRIPVFEENRDNIIGILYAKDILPFLARGETKKKVKEVIRPAYYVPESKRVNELLRELQKNKVHMAIVLDEYGGTAGIVTIEDLLEEIVGEIFDEYDLEEEPMIEKLKDGQIRVDARLDLDEARENLGFTFPEDVESETFGGFVYSLLGRVPEEGETITFNNFLFTIEKVKQRRISKILVKKLEKSEKKEES